MEVKREETPEEKKADRNRILIFLGITFAVTYAVEILMVAPLVGSSDVNEAMMAQKLVAGRLSPDSSPKRALREEICILRSISRDI